MFRVVLYARVSTNDQQTLPMQLRALREYAARRGWSIALIEFGVDPKRIYTDHGLTGTNRLRPGLDQALAAVRAGYSPQSDFGSTAVGVDAWWW